MADHGRAATIAALLCCAAAAMAGAQDAGPTPSPTPKPRRSGGSRLSDVAGSIKLQKTPSASQRVVISNETAGKSQGAVTQAGGYVGTGHDHLAEYVLKSKTIIEEECRKDWSGSMYRHCVEEETKSVESLKRTVATDIPIETFDHIRDICYVEWPRDYGMRDHCEIENRKAYRAMEREDDPDFSPEFLRGLKKICEGEWPNSYTMRQHCLEKRMDFYRPEK